MNTNTQPPGEQMLTEKEVLECVRQANCFGKAVLTYESDPYAVTTASSVLMQLSAAIQSALLAKVAAQQREPVAWINYATIVKDGELAGHHAPELGFKRLSYGYDMSKSIPLYASPPTVPVKADKAAEPWRDLLAEIADHLAEMYAKYQVKIGPFASQSQRLNVAARALLAVPQEAQGSEPKDEFLKALKANPGNCEHGVWKGFKCDGCVSPGADAAPKDGASLMRSQLLQLLSKASFSHQGDAYTANNLANGLAALAASMNSWRRAIDEALVASCLDCTSESESAEQALARLIQWEVQMALDPKISAEAAALVKRGADAVQGEPSAYVSDIEVADALARMKIPCFTKPAEQMRNTLELFLAERPSSVRADAGNVQGEASAKERAWDRVRRSCVLRDAPTTIGALADTMDRILDEENIAW